MAFTALLSCACHDYHKNLAENVLSVRDVCSILHVTGTKVGDEVEANQPVAQSPDSEMIQGCVECGAPPCGCSSASACCWPRSMRACRRCSILLQIFCMENGECSCRSDVLPFLCMIIEPEIHDVLAFSNSTVISIHFYECYIILLVKGVSFTTSACL